MPTLEVDLLYAAIDPYDQHHEIADRILKASRKRKIEVQVNGIALHELELNLKAGNILIEGVKAKPSDIAEFFLDLSTVMSIHNIGVLPFSCEVIAKAAQLRDKYRLTFYDSHHAASALLHDSRIISTDRAYRAVENLQLIDPYKLE